MCGPAEAVCGITTQVDDDGTFTDDLGITDVAILCCPFPEWGTTWSRETDKGIKTGRYRAMPPPS